MISERSKKVDASGIRKVFELAAKMKNPINLSIGQPDFDVPEVAKKAACDMINKGMNRYTLTQGTNEFREMVQKYIKTSRGVDTDMDQVLITSGVSGALMLALMAIINPGDEAIIFDPYFVMYKHLVNLMDGVPVIVSTYPDFKIDPAKLEAAITDKTKVILLNSPSNPTGNVYTTEDIKGLVAVAKKHNILIISDEIYDSFVYDGEFDSPIKYTDNVMLMGGYSKTFAMTGWRLGYAVGPVDIIEAMKKLQQYSFVCAPAPFQYAVLATEVVDTTTYRDEYRKKRDIVYAGLKDNFIVNKPGGAFYIFPQLKHGNAEEFVKLAIENNVLIIPGNVFSEENTNFRISFAASEQTLREGVEVLNRVALEYYKKFE